MYKGEKRKKWRFFYYLLILFLYTFSSSISYSPKLHLNDKLLSAKQQQLRSLIHLYESEVEWLSLGSRLWFGPIRGRHVALLVDFSDSMCFGDIYSHYLSALHVAVEEQLVTMDRVYVFSIGTETSDPVIFDMRYNTRLGTICVFTFLVTKDYSPWSEREIWPFLRVPVSPKL